MGRHAAGGPPDAPGGGTPPGIRRTGRRRVSTTAAPGSDPTPQALPERAPVRAAEDTDESWGDRPAAAGSSGPNDDRLKRDVPPHW
ncbi:hypothetical protein [Herbiconiux liangxiaofengii]|uniref:hypothetical protein n=1 Tax=Herbiconiux liangxiaofengii TaxID=3342795 RepID=UPI0035B7B7EA